MEEITEPSGLDQLYAWYVLAVTTGMRQGELLGLKRDDVDLEAGTLRVRRTVYNGKAKAPKISSGRRTIKLAKLKNALTKLRKEGKIEDTGNERNQAREVQLKGVPIVPTTKLAF